MFLSKSTKCMPLSAELPFCGTYTTDMPAIREATQTKLSELINIVCLNMAPLFLTSGGAFPTTYGSIPECSTKMPVQTAYSDPTHCRHVFLSIIVINQ